MIDWHQRVKENSREASMGGRGTGVPNARERIFRVNEFWELILEYEGRLKEEILARFSLKFGTCRRTMLDYLKVLILNKKIMEVNKRLYRHEK